MRIFCFIPARMGSSRFPGKPLFKILGKPLLQWVYEGSKNAEIDELYVTTPDKEIIDFCAQNKYQVIKTSNNHERCLDRIHEAYFRLDNRSADDIIICMQGDEPLITPKMINNILSFHKSKNCDFAVSTVLITEAEFKNESIVKVAYDDDFKTIYTSRSPIPHSKDGYKKSVRINGLFTLSPIGLETFFNLPPSRLEILESCDTNRILGTQLKQYVCIQKDCPTQQSVDVPNDIKLVEQILENKI